MTQKPENSAIEEEIILPENLLSLGSVLGEGVTPLDVSMVLAKVFRVQYAEVALLRLDGGLLKFIFPEHLRTTGAIPISSKAVAAHTALSKKAEIFNNFARVKHASIFETIKPIGAEAEVAAVPAPIQKLMSVPYSIRIRPCSAFSRSHEKVWTRASRRTSAAKTFTIWNLPLACWRLRP